NLLDEAAIAGRVAVGDDDRIEGALLGAAAGEANSQHFSSVLLGSSFSSGDQFFLPNGKPERPGRPLPPPSWALSFSRSPGLMFLSASPRPAGIPPPPPPGICGMPPPPPMPPI